MSVDVDVYDGDELHEFSNVVKARRTKAGGVEVSYMEDGKERKAVFSNSDIVAVVDRNED